MDYSGWLATQLQIRPQQVDAAVALLDAENTIPFIARYRKEATGGLDEEQLWQLSEMLTKRRALEARRETVIRTISEQGNLNPELHQKLQEADTLTVLEDLYQPYKPKRRTRASIAREQGLQGLADLILKQDSSKWSLDEFAEKYLNEEVPDSETAFAGARDIVAETISDYTEVRQKTRRKSQENGLLKTEKIVDAEDPKGVYELYYEFNQRIPYIKAHQVLAINRAEVDKVIRIHIDIPERDWREAIERIYPVNSNSPLKNQLEEAIEEAAKRLLLPAIERDLRRQLKEEAQQHAILVFAKNLRGLLSQPPLTNHTVLGIDPGFRTGCKAAVVDSTGKVLETGTIYPHEPRNQWKESLDALKSLIKKHAVTLIAIGNGTASRETEQLAAALTREQSGIHYLIVNEAGASVYSASRLARQEMPDLDVSLRGAVSIARRVQDPLAEYVKIEARSIGIGLYQHDVDQKELERTLGSVVESVVNAVGVDLNTASPALLTRVAGIGPKIAERIVAYRDKHGAFKNRAELLSVPGLGPKAFEQAAGFLRIQNGQNQLDGSAIHPESYPVAIKILKKAGLEISTSVEARKNPLEAMTNKISLEELAEELHIGVPTLEDIYEQLLRPGRDPRQDLPAPILRDDVLKMEDLASGMNLKGTVRNVVDFGAFVDIGVKQDGLLHRSQIPKGIDLDVGAVVDVQIINIDMERSRIGLRWLGSE